MGYRERDAVKAYIANQEEHHQKKTYLEEIERFYREAGVEFDLKYLA